MGKKGKSPQHISTDDAGQCVGTHAAANPQDETRPPKMGSIAEDDTSNEECDVFRSRPLTPISPEAEQHLEPLEESGDENWYRDYDSGSDRGEFEGVSGPRLLRRGRKTRQQLQQRVEYLVTELRQKQEAFKRRQRNLAKSVGTRVKSGFLHQQERVVQRSKQMAKKLQSGRSRAWRHKWVFALVQADFVVTAYWLGASPDTFYWYYTAQMAFVMSGKIWDYRVTEQHYFLLDFCFFANAMTLLWLWFFPTSGALFNACESFCGLLAISVVVFRNSCVPHDFARISNAYVHYPQVVVMLSARHRCSGDLCLGIAEGESFSWYMRMRQAWSYYMLWAVLYSSVIFVFAKKRIERKRRDTLYGYFADTLKFKDKLPNWLRPQQAFMMGHQALFLSGIWWVLLPMSCQIVAAAVAIMVFFHNGGRFYVDHFWKAYERNTCLYVDAASSMMSKTADRGMEGERTNEKGSHSSLDTKADEKEASDDCNSPEHAGPELKADQ